MVFEPEKLPWKSLLSAMTPQLEKLVADVTAAAVAVALSRGLAFNQETIAETVAAWMPGYITAWEKAIVETTTDRVTAAVAAYTAGDIGIDEMLDRVDKLFDPARAELIAVSETTRVFDVVNGFINENAGVERVRFLTVRDPFVCPICQEYDNQVYDVDDAPQPVEDTHYGCYPAGVLVVPGGKTRTATTRDYRGEIVIIRTAAGHELSCTPNHPVLTASGWVPAGGLREGDYVISSTSEVIRIRDYDNQVPSPIEEVTSAFMGNLGVTTRKVPVSAPDFHGDGIGSKIAVVGTDRLLWDSRHASRSQKFLQHMFAWGVMGKQRLPSVRAFDAFRDGHYTSPRGLVGGISLGRTLFSRHRCPLQSLGFRLPTALYPMPLQAARDKQARNAEGVSYGILRNSRFVHRDQGGFIDLGSPSFRNPDKSVLDSIARDAEVRRNIADTLTGQVAADDIVSVERKRLEAHVYNLETSLGFIVAAGVVTSNCRCFLAPEIPEAESREPVTVAA